MSLNYQQFKAKSINKRIIFLPTFSKSKNIKLNCNLLNWARLLFLFQPFNSFGMRSDLFYLEFSRRIIIFRKSLCRGRKRLSFGILKHLWLLFNLMMLLFLIVWRNYKKWAAFVLFIMSLNTNGNSASLRIHKRYLCHWAWIHRQGDSSSDQKAL